MALRTIELADVERRIIPILGMHRSGTSMLTRALQALGVPLGGPLLGPAADNPRGFWEHLFVQKLNMRLLSGSGCDPDGFDRPEVLTRASHQVARYAEPLAATLERFLASAAPGGAFGFKDPRTCVTLPFWLAVLARLGVQDVRPIVVVRHPLACAASLERRGDACKDAADPRGFWLDVWSTYYMLLSAHVPDGSLWLRHEDLVAPERAESTLGRAAAYLDLRPAQLGPALATVDTHLLHHRDAEGDSTGVDMIDAQYRALCKRARACERNHAPPRTRPVRSAAHRATEATEYGNQAPPDCVYVVTPEGYPHSRAFEEQALALHHGLADLGAHAPIVTEPWQLGQRPIVLGPQLLVDGPQRLPEGAILYNLEQVSPGSPWFTDRYRALLGRHRVWDYDPRNLNALRAWGVRGARLCRPGSHPALAGIELLPESQRDIDVLFYGSLNERRQAVLEGLSEAGLAVVHLFGVYGAERDAFIRRAKVVLNVHHYSAQVLEMVRIGYLLNNGVCVVSEPDGDDAPASELTAGIWIAPYMELIDACMHAVIDRERREAIAQAGKRLFAARTQADELRAALASPTL